MRFFIISLLLLLPLLDVSAQPDTEVFIIDILKEDGVVYTSNFKNVSSNPGYDNQPYFTNGSLLYAGTENNQTEIMIWSDPEGSPNRVNQPTPGGEYSPQQAPNGIGYTAVRLDTTGLQRLYYYDPEGKSSRVGDLQVAYYAFYQKEFLLASVLSENRLDLVMTDLRTMKHDTLLENSGRSIHRRPQTKAMSYTVVNEEGNHDVYQLDLNSMESFFICQLPIGIQDYAWLSESELIIGSNSSLYTYDLFGDSQWNIYADLSDHKVKNITRIAVNWDGNQLAFAAEIND